MTARAFGDQGPNGEEEAARDGVWGQGRFGGVDKGRRSPSTESMEVGAGMRTMDHHAEAGVPGHAVASCAAEPEEDHARGLLLIGLFKFSKAIFFAAVGAGALDLVHKNLGDMLMRVIAALHMDPEGHIVGILMDRADLIGHHQLRQGAIFSFAYAALCVVEGTGLTLRKVWAEYFTVILTAGALPWESYELIAHYSAYKISFLAINLVVLFYLLWVLKRKRAAEAGC